MINKNIKSSLANLSPKTTNRKQNRLLPNILTTSYDQPKATQNKLCSVSFAAPMASKSNNKYIKSRNTETKHSRTGSFKCKQRSLSKQNMSKMQNSMMRFIQKQNNFMKTLTQKRKQKKHFSAESFKNQEMDFFNSLGLHNLTNQQVTEEQIISREYKFKNLPSQCYDSQFIYHRQGSCLTILNNKPYLFGGTIRRKSYFHQLDNKMNTDVLFHSYSNGLWQRQPIANQLSSDKHNLIHHTTNTISKKLLLLIGGMMGDSQKTLSKFNESILIYNSETKKMQQISWNNCIRSHASTSFENNTIIHGGLNEDGKIRNDLFIVTLHGHSNNYTIKVSRYQTSQAVVHHTIVNTLGEDKNFMINLRENNGVYMFGGEDSFGNVDNKLKLLRIYALSQLQRKSIKTFQVLQTIGQPPAPRKNHSMTLLPKKNSIVIIGGLDSQINLLSDVWLIQLFHLKWCRVQTDPKIQTIFGGICKHATAYNNNSIYILGGRCQKDIGSSNLWQLDFNMQIFQRKAKEKKVSVISKISSCWTIGKTEKYYQDRDKCIQLPEINFQ